MTEQLYGLHKPTTLQLLDLFSPVPAPSTITADPGSLGNNALWAADALHRANNLAQMSAALLSARVTRSYGNPPEESVAAARALARAYAELGAAEVAGQQTPCGPLLEAIVVRLVSLFASPALELCLSLEDVYLVSEKRRALILIASELVINTLKYAFPAGEAGTLVFKLTRAADEIMLLVADNGIGFTPQSTAGSGSMLMLRMAALIEAKICYQSGAAGLSVTVTMPSE